jgi:hypothetical protein
MASEVNGMRFVAMHRMNCTTFECFAWICSQRKCPTKLLGTPRAIPLGTPPWGWRRQHASRGSLAAATHSPQCLPVERRTGRGIRDPLPCILYKLSKGNAHGIMEKEAKDVNYYVR